MTTNTVRYSFGDPSQLRQVEANVDPHIRVKKLLEQLIPFMKLPAVDHRGVQFIHLLAYNNRFLSEEETLAQAGIPPGALIEVIARAMDMGAYQRNPREWADFEALMQLQEANPQVFDLEIRGRAFDDAPLGYRLTFKTVAGPIIDAASVGRTSAKPLLQPNGDLKLAENFTVEIFVLERYPFIEPAFFYVDPILFHPNVNPYSRKACLYERWLPIHSLAESAQRFIEQICYVAPYARGHHILNFEADSWMADYLKVNPKAIPFKNSKGAGAPILCKVNEAVPDLEFDPDDGFDPTVVPTFA